MRDDDVCMNQKGDDFWSDHGKLRRVLHAEPVQAVNVIRPLWLEEAVSLRWLDSQLFDSMS